MDRILVVDDSTLMRRAIREIVEPEGFAVVAEARDGVEAVELFDALRPGLVLVDLLMPRRSGVETVAEIRRLDTEAGVLVAAGLGQEELAAAAVVEGADDFVRKPFHPRRLLRALERARPKQLIPARPS